MGLKQLVLDGTAHEIISELSLVASKSTMIQNKSAGRIVVYPSDTQPTVGEEMNLGFFVKSGEIITIPPNAASKCYISGNVGVVAILNY